MVEKWFGANHHIFTPLLVADFHFCPKRYVFPDFPRPPPLLLEGGVLAPFLHPLCTLCAPFVHPPFCARTTFLQPFCPPFVRWNPLHAPFLRGGFRAKEFCKKGTKCIHRVQMHPPGSNLVSQAYMHFDSKFERLMPVFSGYTAEHIKVTIFFELRPTRGHCPMDPWG